MAHIFNVGTRQPGVLESQPDVVPPGAAGKKWFIHAVMAQADLDDPTVSFDVRLYVRNPDLSWPGVDQEYADTGRFTGGPNKGKNGAPTDAPGFRIDGDEVVGKTVKFRLEVFGRAVDMGLDADPV